MSPALSVMSSVTAALGLVLSGGKVGRRVASLSPLGWTFICSWKMLDGFCHYYLVLRLSLLPEKSSPISDDCSLVDVIYINQS